MGPQNRTAFQHLLSANHGPVQLAKASALHIFLKAKKDNIRSLGNLKDGLQIGENYCTSLNFFDDNDTVAL